MKNLLYSAAIIFISIGCSPDSINNLPEGNYLDINVIKEYLPKNYIAENDIIFINEVGDELKLKVKYNEGLTERSYHGKSYNTESFEATIYNPNNINFNILLKGSTNYTMNGNVATALWMVLMPLNDSGTTAATIRFVDGDPLAELYPEFFDSISLLNREYASAFIAIGKQGNVVYDAYSELGINSEYGVIAFRDANNSLWVFDRFIK